MSEMSEDEMCTVNLVATLLQLGLASDCEEAMRMMCQSQLSIENVPKAETRFVFVEKNDLYNKIKLGLPVKLEKYRVEYHCKDNIRSALIDEMRQRTRKYERRSEKIEQPKKSCIDKDYVKRAGKYTIDQI